MKSRTMEILRHGQDNNGVILTGRLEGKMPASSLYARIWELKKNGHIEQLARGKYKLTDSGRVMLEKEMAGRVELTTRPGVGYIPTPTTNTPHEPITSKFFPETAQAINKQNEPEQPKLVKFEKDAGYWEDMYWREVEFMKEILRNLSQR